MIYWNAVDVFFTTFLIILIIIVSALLADYDNISRYFMRFLKKIRQVLPRRVAFFPYWSFFKK